MGCCDWRPTKAAPNLERGPNCHKTQWASLPYLGAWRTNISINNWEPVCSHEQGQPISAAAAAARFAPKMRSPWAFSAWGCCSMNYRSVKYDVSKVLMWVRCVKHVRPWVSGWIDAPHSDLCDARGTTCQLCRKGRRSTLVFPFAGKRGRESNVRYLTRSCSAPWPYGVSPEASQFRF